MKKNDTLRELLIGIFIIALIEQILCLIFLERHLYHAVGLWTGIFLGMGLAIHMKRSIEDALDLSAEAAEKYMRGATMKRMLISCIVIGIVLYFDWGNSLTILAGIFALKIAAYLQPFMHNVFFRK